MSFIEKLKRVRVPEQQLSSQEQIIMRLDFFSYVLSLGAIYIIIGLKQDVLGLILFGLYLTLEVYLGLMEKRTGLQIVGNIPDSPVDFIRGKYSVKDALLLRLLKIALFSFIIFLYYYQGPLTKLINE